MKRRFGMRNRIVGREHPWTCGTPMRIQVSLEIYSDQIDCSEDSDVIKSTHRPSVPSEYVRHANGQGSLQLQNRPGRQAVVVCDKSRAWKA